MAKKTPSTSSVGRSIKLGGLVGRVGASMLGRRLTDIGRSDDERRQREARNLIRNAHRVVATLGEMKGAAMKVGQMLSLQEGLLPPEVAEVLAGLQQQAPKVPSEVMRFEVEGALGDVDAHFAHLDQEAFAAASIGQVHRGRLHDGREVAVKIQYPLIDQIVRADLKSLKHLVGSLVAMVSEVDFEPIWAEVRDRLVEELDYSVEATSMREMAELERDVPSIVIPDVVPELTTANVLTMIFEPAMGADEACSDAFDQDLRTGGAPNSSISTCAGCSATVCCTPIRISPTSASARTVLSWCTTSGASNGCPRTWSPGTAACSPWSPPDSGAKCRRSSAKWVSGDATGPPSLPS
jgi:hypothetical protein